MLFLCCLSVCFETFNFLSIPISAYLFFMSIRTDRHLCILFFFFPFKLQDSIDDRFRSTSQLTTSSETIKQIIEVRFTLNVKVLCVVLLCLSHRFDIFSFRMFFCMPCLSCLLLKQVPILAFLFSILMRSKLELTIWSRRLSMTCTVSLLLTKGSFSFSSRRKQLRVPR